MGQLRWLTRRKTTGGLLRGKATQFVRTSRRQSRSSSQLLTMIPPKRCRCPPTDRDLHSVRRRTEPIPRSGWCPTEALKREPRTINSAAASHSAAPELRSRVRKELEWSPDPTSVGIVVCRSNVCRSEGGDSQSMQSFTAPEPLRANPRVPLEKFRANAAAPP